MKHFATGNTSMPTLRFFPLACLCALIFSGLLAGAAPEDADREFKYDLRLCRALVTCRVRMYDYALTHISQMLTKYPDKKDAILIEQARFYVLLNKKTAADAAVAQIQEASPYFSRAQLFIADMAKRGGLPQKAEEALKRYFAKNPKPAGPDPEDVDE